MRRLSKIENGLIFKEEFDGVLNSLLRNDSDGVISNGSFSFKNGYLYTYVLPYKDCVMQVNNSFIPLQQNMAGIKLNKLDSELYFYEYNGQVDNGQVDIGILPYLKVVKEDDMFQGYGSNNNIEWTDIGECLFRDCESMGLAVYGDQLYTVDYVALYKKNFIRLDSLIAGYRIEAQNDNRTWVYNTESDIQDLYLNYPFTGTIKVFDGLNNLTALLNIENGWGGDVYRLNLNVDIRDSNNDSLTFINVRNIGNLTGSFTQKLFHAVNLENTSINIKLSIADYSPFYTWTSLANSVNGEPSVYDKYIFIELAPLETKDFYIGIQRQVYEGDINDDITKCLFYLIVE